MNAPRKTTRLDGPLSDLALFGGEPTFPEILHIGRPNLGDREQLLARINDMLDRRCLSNDGPFLKDFERRVAEVAGVKHCIAMCNATVALEIAMRALGLSGEVIVPSYTFVATAHALQWQQITPVFADVDPATHTLDPAAVERMITPRTTGIVGVHLWGRGCDVDGLQAVARKHKLKLMFDAAHAFNCTVGGTPIGSFGDAEVFSFHATKFVNCFEGGAVVTNDDDLAARIKLMKNFGFRGMDDVGYIGINGKMSEASAAMGLTSIESMGQFMATNRRNYDLYCDGLRAVPGVRVLPYDDSERNNYQYVVIEVDPAQAGLTRDQLMNVLHAERVLARRYFFPGVHKMEPYRSHFPHAELLLPNTKRLTQRVLLLPTGTAVDEETVARVCGLVRFAVARGTEIAARLEPATPATEAELRASVA